MSPAVLDTDMLNEIFKRRNANVGSRAADYLNSHQQFAFSDFTRFEVSRGLRHKRSLRLISQFAQLCNRCLIFPVTAEILDVAADLWVIAHNGGHSRRDADLIIAATALVHKRSLVTGNTSHFDWIPGMALANWREP